MIAKVDIGEIDSFESLIESEEKLFGNKFNAWNALERAAGFEDFDCRLMAIARRMHPSGYNYHNTSLSRSEGSDGNRNRHFNKIDGGILKFNGIELFVGVTSKDLVCDNGKIVRVKVSTEILSENIAEQFIKHHMMDKFRIASAQLLTMTSHDFTHNCTLLAAIFTALFNRDNKRNDIIDGYENFSLALHQMVFAIARKISGEVDKVMEPAMKCASLIETYNANSRYSEKDRIVDALYEMMFYKLKNLVDGHEFLDSAGKFSRDPAVWLRALTKGEKTPCPPFIVEGEEMSVEAICYSAFRYFVAAAGISTVSAGNSQSHASQLIVNGFNNRVH